MRQETTDCRSVTFTILQINLDRGREAHDILNATAAQIHADILIISEPNKAIVSSPLWYTDDRKDAAIRLRNRNLTAHARGAGRGYVWVDLVDVIIYSCYFSPNAEILDFETALLDLKETIVNKGKESVFCGNFNAKAPEWGMTYTDRRGDMVTSWMAELSLVVINTGTEPTFVRGTSNSILDLTLATENVSTRLRNWSVMDKESLSLHRYITFELTGKSNTAPQPTISLGWALKKINTEKFYTEIRRQVTGNNVDSADKLVKILTKVCDYSMPRKSTSHRGGPVYWWTSEIAQLRNACVSARRAYSRHGRSAATGKQLRLNYQRARKLLRQKKRVKNKLLGGTFARYRQRHLRERVPHCNDKT